MVDACAVTGPVARIASARARAAVSASATAALVSTRTSRMPPSGSPTMTTANVPPVSPTPGLLSAGSPPTVTSVAPNEPIRRSTNGGLGLRATSATSLAPWRYEHQASGIASAGVTSTPRTAETASVVRSSQAGRKGIAVSCARTPPDQTLDQTMVAITTENHRERATRIVRDLDCCRRQAPRASSRWLVRWTRCWAGRAWPGCCPDNTMVPRTMGLAASPGSGCTITADARMAIRTARWMCRDQVTGRFTR